MNNKLIILISIILSSCASLKKCPKTDGTNPVIDTKTCTVFVRNSYYADQLSPDLKEKITQGRRLKYIWVSTKTVGTVTTPEHFELAVDTEDSQ